MIRLSAEAEPEIYETTRTFGTMLENVVVDERGVLDLDDDSKTENTRAAYKLEQISNALPTKRAGHPSAVVMLDRRRVRDPAADRAADARRRRCSTSSPASRRSSPGTEIGVTEPQPTFSTCFGAPFLPQPPAVYARMLGEKLDAARRDGLARQHGLDGRAVRRGQPDADRGDARAAPRGARRARSTASSTASTTLFGFEVPTQVPGVDAGAARPALDVARPGRVRPQGARARADVPRRTSRSSQADGRPTLRRAGPRL